MNVKKFKFVGCLIFHNSPLTLFDILQLLLVRYSQAKE